MGSSTKDGGTGFTSAQRSSNRHPVKLTDIFWAKQASLEAYALCLAGVCANPAKPTP